MRIACFFTRWPSTTDGQTGSGKTFSMGTAIVHESPPQQASGSKGRPASAAGQVAGQVISAVAAPRPHSSAAAAAQVPPPQPTGARAADGVIPRALASLFRAVRAKAEPRPLAAADALLPEVAAVADALRPGVVLKVSYLEIYNEEIRWRF
jgi:hypothetical protein